MPEIITWDDILRDLGIGGRDVGFVEGIEGAPGGMYRGPAKEAREIEEVDGTYLEIEFEWFAHYSITGSVGFWHILHEESKIKFAKKLVSFMLEEDGSINFEIPDFATGTIYPPGDNLDPKEVKGFDHTSGLLN